MKDKQLKIRITTELFDAFTKKCYDLRVTKTAAIEKFIKYYIKHEPK